MDNQLNGASFRSGIFLIAVAIFTFASAALAKEAEQPTAIVVAPIHDAQIVRGDDGMDHVEYELLVVNVFPEPVTLSRVTVLDAAGKELTRIEGNTLAAATQPLFSRTASPVVPASGAVAVEVDLILPPDTAPPRVMHKIVYALAPHSELAPMIGRAEVDAPEITIDRRPAMLLEPPVKGEGWIVSSGCCKPNIHRDLRVAIGGLRIETPETFAIDFAKMQNGRIFDDDGSKIEQHYAFGQDVLAVADGTVVSVQDGKPETAPNVPMKPATKEDYGGNHVMLQIAPDVFAMYVHLHPGSLRVKVGDRVRAGTPLARIGNTGPSLGPHLHFGLSDKPDLYAGRSLPFGFHSFTKMGMIDFEASRADKVIVVPDLRPVRSAYPLYGSVLNFR